METNNEAAAETTTVYLGDDKAGIIVHNADGTHEAFDLSDISVYCGPSYLIACRTLTNLL